MRFDTSMESLIGIGRSESFADLNFAKNIIGSSSNLMNPSGDCRYLYFYHKLKVELFMEENY
jgi:hypothetical protein